MKVYDWAKKNTWIISFTMGVVFFILLYGIDKIIPTNVEWLTAGLWEDDTLNDIYMHYMGWVAYRNSNWMFPFGTINNLMYPHNTNLAYTDAIPVVALICKILSPILPKSFQYWGIYGAITFGMNCALGNVIISRFVNSVLVPIVGSLFFVLSFPLLQRMFFHTALASHWIVLLGIVWVIYNQKWSNKKKFVLWFLLGILSIGIQPYFVPMTAICLMMALLYDVLQKQNFIVGISKIAGYAIGIIAYYFLVVGVDSNVANTAPSLGIYSFNLVGFINPMDKGSILPEISVGWGQYEGFAYIGIGVILMYIALVVGIVTNNVLKKKIRYNKKMLGILAFGCFISVIFAASPIITFATKSFEIPVGNMIYNLWSTFRSSGRIAWLAMYIIVATAFIGVYKIWGNKKAIIFMCICLVAQAVDIFPYAYRIHETWKKSEVLELKAEVFDNGKWDDIVRQVDCECIMLTNSYGIYSDGSGYYEDIARYAIENGIPLNRFRLARSYMYNLHDELIESFDSGDNLLWIWPKDNSLLYQNEDLHYYNIDGYLIATRVELNGYKEVNHDERGKVNLLVDNTFMTKISSGNEESTYTFDIEPGNYFLEIRGENLADISVTVLVDEQALDCQRIDKDNHTEFIFANDTEGRLRIVLKNDGKYEIDIESMFVEQGDKK